MANVIILTGPAQCGKSTVGRLFMQEKNESFKPVQIKKYTTRAPRINDEDVICVDEIPEECDIKYEQYGVQYGLELKELYKHLEKEETPIIVLNDIRAVEDLKRVLGNMIYALFLYRKPAVYEDFYTQEKERAGDKKDDQEIEKIAKTRYDKAKAIYRIYIENIQMFDGVILNEDNMEDITKEQIKHIVNELTKSVEALEE